MPLRMYTIFDSPDDCRGWFVAREQIVSAGTVTPGRFVCKTKTLDECREQLQHNVEHVLENLGREVDDAPHIVETWI